MIIDTNVLSALFSKDQNLKTKAAQFLGSLPRISTSVIVVYEIEYGLRKLGSKKLLAGFKELIADEDSFEVIPVTQEIGSLAAEKRANMIAKGITLHSEDLFIGATAKILQVPLATQNRKDFEAWDIELISPFT